MKGVHPSMFGGVTFFELRTGWKGLLILVFLILILAAGMAQMFPSIRDSNPVTIDVPEEVGGTITISWKEQEGASTYVLGEMKSLLEGVNIIYTGYDTEYSFDYDFDEERNYLVGTEIDGDFTLVGMTSTSGQSNPFEGMMDNPAWAGITGGRDINMIEIKGFISMEFFSWWWIIAGAFIAYMAVSTIASDFEGKRMDLIFSTPISRRRYIIEKFLAMTFISLFMVLVAIGGLISGIESIGESNEFPADIVFMSVLGCLPVLTLFASIGIFTSVLFKKIKIGIGITLTFIFGGFFAYTFGSLSEDLSWMKSISFMNYWDYNAVIFDGEFKILPFIGLFIATIIFVILSAYIFEKRDIPA